VSRDSSGCVLSSGTEVVLAVEVGRACATGPMPERRVSWMPGAEGAPLEMGLRWLWVLEWELGGAIRIAWRWVS
jgi:hypothetical protein